MDRSSVKRAAAVLSQLKRQQVDESSRSRSVSPVRESEHHSLTEDEEEDKEEEEEGEEGEEEEEEEKEDALSDKENMPPRAPVSANQNCKACDTPILAVDLAHCTDCAARIHQDGKGCAQPLLAGLSVKLVHNKKKQYCRTCWVGLLYLHSCLISCCCELRTPRSNSARWSPPNVATVV